MPDLKGIQIERISDNDKCLNRFLQECTPSSISLLSINWYRNNEIAIKSSYYINSLWKVAATTANEIFFYCIDFSAEDLQTVIKAARNTERIVFSFCCIHCSSCLDFGVDQSYNTKFLSFQHWGRTDYKERTTDWINNPSCFENIVNAICSSGMKASLQKVSIYRNNTLNKSNLQELFNAKGIFHISIVEEGSNPISL